MHRNNHWIYRCCNAIYRAGQAVFLVVLLSLSACGKDKEKTVTIVALGDSLTAGYGLPPEDAFPAQLQQKLKDEGYAQVVVNNAGVSGDTTADGLARLDAVLAQKPDIVILALGANDMLRRISPVATRRNLDAIITRLQDAGIKVLLAGMKAGLQTGMHYAEEFNTIYPDLSEQYGLGYYPFFLEGVMMRRELNLGDGIHPNAQGVGVMVDGLYPVLEKML